MKKHIKLFWVAALAVLIIFTIEGCGDSSSGGIISPPGEGIGITVPGAVLNFTATAGDERVFLTWEAPLNDGGSDITGYEVTRDNWTSKVIKAASELTHIFTGLENGTEYTFKVRALNAEGFGPESGDTTTPDVGIGPTAPGAVLYFTAVPGNRKVDLYWNAPSDNGGSAITAYEVTRDDWVSIDTKTAGESRYTFDSLSNGTEYTFKVRAVNIAGVGPESEQTATPDVVIGPTAPGPVLNFNVTPGLMGVYLSWETPFYDGGSDIIRYEVSSDNGTTWVTASSNTGHTFTGLENGTLYTFNVRAVNMIDAGPESARTATPDADAGISNMAQLSNYLNSLPENTPETPYIIFFNAGADISNLSDVLYNNSVKFVSLDLSNLSITSVYFGRSSLVSIILPDSVISIGDYAFENCTNLESINIPVGVTSIAINAFRGCTNLRNITIVTDKVSNSQSANWGNRFPATDLNITFLADIGNYAFHYCDRLASVTIGDGVQSIGEWAFENCSSLESVTIGDGVENIEDYAFYGCDSLDTINVSSGNATYNSIDGILYNKEASILILCPEGKTDVNIPSSVKTMGEWSFLNCKKIESINIPEGIESIEQDAFYGCINLHNITIATDKVSNTWDNNWGYRFPATNLNVIFLVNIGENAFYNCNNLVSITIGDGVESIGQEAFQSCSNLEIINVSSGNTTYSSIDNILYNKDASILIKCPERSTDVSIPASVVSIETRAFYGCGNIQNIIIPSNIESIGSYAFFNCSNLRNIIIATDKVSNSSSANWGHRFSATNLNVTFLVNIGDNAFNNSTRLENITIGSGVESIGNNAFYRCSSLESITIPDSIINIGDSAFRGCSILESITIPENVESIGEYAFYDCNSLISITIPASVTSISDWIFYSCSSLASVTIKDGVKSIGQAAFGGCSSLKSLSIPNSVTSIGAAAFYDCSNLENITIPISINSVSSNTFRNCTGLESITIPGNIENIGDNAFYGCSNLENVTIKEGVESIGGNAFRDCSGLESIAIPASITTIGSNAFYGCNDLRNITIATDKVYNYGGNNWGTRFLATDLNVTFLVDIGNYVFNSCTRLVSLTIGDSVESIALNNAFYNCSSLEIIDVSSGNTTYSSMDGILYDKEMDVLVMCPGGKTNVIIPGSVESICDYAFAYSNLKNVTIGTGVTSIGSSTFYGCNGLESITIPANVTNIGTNAFFGCTNLRNITIATDKVSNTISNNWTNRFSATNLNVTFLADVGDYALYGCKNLESITLNSNVTSIGYRSFATISSLKNITIPDSVKNIGDIAFWASSNLSSVTFEGTIPWGGFSTNSAFEGDLREKFYATDSSNGTPGTYTRVPSTAVWTLVTP